MIWDFESNESTLKRSPTPSFGWEGVAIQALQTHLKSKGWLFVLFCELEESFQERSRKKSSPRQFFFVMCRSFVGREPFEPFADFSNFRSFNRNGGGIGGATTSILVTLLLLWRFQFGIWEPLVPAWRQGWDLKVTEAKSMTWFVIYPIFGIGRFTAFHSVQWDIPSNLVFDSHRISLKAVLGKGDDWESTARRLEIRVRSNRRKGESTWLSCSLFACWFCRVQTWVFGFLFSLFFLLLFLHGSSVFRDAFASSVLAALLFWICVCICASDAKCHSRYSDRPLGAQTS